MWKNRFKRFLLNWVDVFVVVVLLILCLTWPEICRAGEKQCVVGKPTHCVQPVNPGELVPFEGQLYTPELALDQAEKAHSFAARLDLEVKRVAESYEIQLELERKLREIDLQAASDREHALQQAIKNNQPPFYERPAFVIPVTAVFVTAAILGAVALSAELGQAVWQ